MYGVRKGAYRDFMRKPEGRRLLGKHMLNWEDNTEMDPREV
jgi:hypothetical protein